MLSLRIGSFSRALPGEKECGDRFAVFTGPLATTIVVADGLGHGPEAARAAVLAVERVRERLDASLSELMRDLHTTLARTRGAAVVLLRIETATGVLTHSAVGNVELTGLTREAVKPVTMPGIVGVRARKIVETRYRLHPGDLLIAFTDGVSSRLPLESFREVEVDTLARNIVAAHGKEVDDAACVVVRC
ncbi:MAG: SpoIIE family protein phosphatase [Polyangiales bacterium]